MSVDVEPFLVADGLDHTFSLKDHTGYSLVRLTAGVARTHNQTVMHTPIPGENPYHADVNGKKTPGTANRLRDASSWVFLAK